MLLIFDPLAWAVLAFLLLYWKASLSWMFLVIPVWVGVRLLLLRSRCINHGIWASSNRTNPPLPTAPARWPSLRTARDAHARLPTTVKIRRAVSVLLAVAFIAYAERLTPPGLWVVAAAFMIAPMIAIWYGDPLGGNLAELFGFEKYDLVVEILGWLVLCLTPVAVYLFKCRIELW